MLFNSVEFILLFLPLTLLGFLILGQLGLYRIIIPWLILASAVFYAWWNPPYIVLIGGSITINYWLGTLLSKLNETRPNLRRTWLAVGIFLNLALIGYYKYSNFFISNLNSTLGTDFHLKSIILPLGISFFTFQQIAYLVDIYQKKTQENSPTSYALFVLFFPQLVAGPIVHHKQIASQFKTQFKAINPKLMVENLSIGITFFSLGLAKKVLLADSFIEYSNSAFSIANRATEIEPLTAWIGVIAYTLQLYFDFSGYSDMAIGLGWMFGIRMPINFNSPYRAVDIRDFWNRWHITLSNFLRDYLYIPLGGNRRGMFRRDVNLLATMSLGGLWHGANWTFIIWGGLHGIYLIINNHWNTWSSSFLNPQFLLKIRPIAYVITFLAVSIGWVFFRAPSLQAAGVMLQGMIDLGQMDGSGSRLVATLFQPIRQFVFQLGLFKDPTWLASITLAIASIHLLFTLGILFFAPNTQQAVAKHGVMAGDRPVQPETPLTNIEGNIEGNIKGNQPDPSLIFGLGVGALLFLSLKHLLSSPASEFLYFNF